MAQYNLLLRVLNALGVVINPATEEKQDAAQISLDSIRGASYFQGTVSAAGVITGLTAIDGSKLSMLDIQHRGTLGQFKFTVAVEGTNDPTANGATDAPGTKGWAALELRSAAGGEMTSIVLGGRYLLLNPTRSIRLRCSSYTYGSAQIDITAKPVPQEDPSRTLSDKDALASLAMTTFGQMQVAQRTFLCGSNFDDTSLDTDIWSNLDANGGSHAFANGVIELHTGTSATGKAGVRSLNLCNVLGAADNAITVRNALGSVTNGKYVFRFGVFTALEGTFVQAAGNGRTLTDVVFNGTTTATSAAGDFSAADLGKRVDSTGNVTIGTTIVQVVSPTQVTLSAAALTSASAQTAIIEGFGFTYVNRKTGVDTTSPFGVIGFAAATPSTGLQLWETMFNPNFLIVRNSGNFVQLQIGTSVLAAMFNEYDLPLTAEAENIGSTIDHVLYLQTLVAERLGQQATIRAGEVFKAGNVLAATSAQIQAQQPDGDFVAVKASGTAYENSTPLGAGATLVTPTIDTDGWDVIDLYIATNQVSASGGIYIEYCEDVQAAVPVYHPGPRFTLGADDVANGFLTLRVNAGLDGFRLTYTNGGTMQGSFYLAETMRTYPVPPQNTLGSIATKSNTATMVRGPIGAFNDSDVWALIGRGLAGGLRISVKEYEAPSPEAKFDSVEGNADNSINSSGATQIAGSIPSDCQAILLQSDPDNGNVVLYISNAQATASASAAMHALGTAASVTIPVGAEQTLWCRASTGSAKTVRWTFLRRAAP